MEIVYKQTVLTKIHFKQNLSLLIDLIFLILVWQSGVSVLLKWSPNSLMDSNGQTNGQTSWSQALSINLATVLYIHCHQVAGRTTTNC